VAALLAAVPYFMAPVLVRTEPVAAQSRSEPMRTNVVPMELPEIVGTEESKNHRGQPTQKIVRYADGTTEITDTDYNSRGQPDRITITHRDGRQTVRDITYAPGR
jgi:hypothetical protein